MSKDNLRDYGLGETTPIGVPTWKAADPEQVCPNCKGVLCEVKVLAEHRMLKGGKGMCTYLGCPACPYASPAMTVADPERSPTKGGRRDAHR